MHKFYRCDRIVRAVVYCASLVVPVVAQAAYSPGGWPTLHLDAGNRRGVDVDILGKQYQSWEALAGATVLTAPVTSPDGHSLYVTTGRASGHSNLYAFSIEGVEQWRSSPWAGASEGVDPCAVLSSPIVDDRGDIFISDCNQLYAFKPDGSEKWTIELPPLQAGDWEAAGDHPVNAFTTAAFTAEGHLVGITNFGDVLIVDRMSGRVLNAAFRLPATNAPYARVLDQPKSLFGNGLLDPTFIEWSWQLIFGGSMRSANTPAVSQDNRIYVVGSSDEPALGALYGLDVETSVEPFEIKLAFSTKIGQGSGSSPALSPEEDQVYVSDELGWFYGLNAKTGEITWKIKTTAAAGAAAVGLDGAVYALQSSGASVIAMESDGRVRWRSDTNAVDHGLPDSWLFGAPTGAANGNPTVTRDSVLVPMLYGYEIPFTNIRIPVKSILVALDIKTGFAESTIVELADDSSGVTAVLSDGTLVNSLGAVMSSAMAPLKPLVNWLLPGEVQMLDPRGGIQVSRPK